ncbi:MAG: T9SS type A sorting domain-containing protein [Flavobacteriaceae bacterium]
MGIHLVWDGQIDYILNDAWFDIPQNFKEQIWSHNYHQDGIDIYLGSSQEGNAFAEARGGVGEYSAFIVSGYYGIYPDYSFWPQSSTMQHELGHVFFLWHTFNGTGEVTANSCSECLYSLDPNNGNAFYCGDYVYDTPPDPNFTPNFDINCNYIGGGQDDCGSNFQPLANNFMSYAPLSCRDSFTPGQKTRMKNAIWYLPFLNQTHLQEYAYVRGKNILCGSESSSYSIYSNDISTISIEVSNNLQVISTSVLTDRINVNVGSNLDIDEEGEVAFIIVKRNGQEIGRKNFWTGLPQTMIENSIDGESVVGPNDVEFYLVPQRLEGASTYMWVFPGFPPLEQEPFVPGNDGWQYNHMTRHHNVLYTMIGTCGGELFIYGINECGDGTVPENVGKVVTVTPNNPNCPPPPNPMPIVYYPNPADSLLSIDLSLQVNGVYTIVVYDQYQTVRYEDTSSNIVKTIDTFNLPNGMYYLHIYDGTALLLSNILIINH